ncbi:MAG TPA: LacI family DNA-binding transcriptional regulator [Fodinibius sp.]|nr:LacI family DNA-binding transcriptional regulator [Fodinibius sp.]
MSQITIYDIAKKAGVSIATVSRVMNNSDDISDKTRKKVRRIADKLGYYPQAYAQGLARRKKDRIMIMVPVISNYFFMEVLAGIQAKIHDNNYELNIFNVGSDEETIYEQVETIIKRQSADGYILISLHFSSGRFENLLKYDTPITLVDETYTNIDSVSVNNVEGTRQAMRYLLDKGCRGIALVGASDRSKPNRQRMAKYKNILRSEGVEVYESLIATGEDMARDGFSERNGYEAMKKILNQQNVPDACFCVSDVQAIGAMKAMREANLNIPIIGYDDITISKYIGLSTIRQPMYEMGNTAVESLLQRMDDKTAKIRQETFQPELVLRKSTEVELP